VRRDEQYPVEFQPFADFFSRGKMSVMDGIEGSAEDTEF
jgi:hypothetical protein